MEYLDVLLAPHIEQLQQIGTVEVSPNDTQLQHHVFARFTSLSNSLLDTHSTFRPRKIHKLLLVLVTLLKSNKLIEHGMYVISIRAMIYV